MSVEARTERRLVTCVFIDVAGSTELTGRIGPERMRRLLDEAFAEISARATDEGGTVEKYIGDEVFILFGAPIAHQDDAARALRVADTSVRWVHRAQLELLLRLAGFARWEIWGGVDRGPVTAETAMLYAVAEGPGA